MNGTRMLGLIGGLGVPAGIYYYNQLIIGHATEDRPLNMLFAHALVPRVVGYVRGGQIGELAEYFAGMLQSLAGGGAQVAAISAVTPHICIERLLEISPLPLVSILDAIRSAAQRGELGKVALLGSRYVIESKIYGALDGFDVVSPTPDEIDAIDKAYFGLALRGYATREERITLDRISNRLVDREGLDNILVSGTDLSPEFAADPPDFPFIDCAGIHINAILDAIQR